MNKQNIHIMYRVKLMEIYLTPIEFRNFITDFLGSSNQPNYKGWDWLGQETEESAQDVLRRSFAWTRSSKGSQYWLKVHNRIELEWYDHIN